MSAGIPRAGGGAARDAAWSAAISEGRLPEDVAARLQGAAAGALPWVATMTPAELLIARSHGCRPIATVAGTCWYSYGRSWTEGHAAGWDAALRRIRREATAAGANAIVDVKMRTIRHTLAQSMDFTLFGTAIRIDGLKPSPDPVVATVPALEFVRLLEMGIVPVGIAIGARFEWLGGGWSGDRGWGGGLGGTSFGSQATRQSIQWQTSVMGGSQPVDALTDFWEAIRRDAHADLRAHAATMGNGVLADIHFGQLLRQERDKQPPAFLGRHIVIGTVVDTPRNAPVPHHIRRVADMAVPASPLDTRAAMRHGSYADQLGESEGGI